MCTPVLINVLLTLSSRVEVLDFCFDVHDQKSVCFDFLRQTLVCFVFLDQFLLCFDFFWTKTKKFSSLFDFVRLRSDMFRLSRPKLECFDRHFKKF